MSSLLRYMRIFLFIRVPKSTKKDYYFDPKIMTLGDLDFESEKAQSKITDLEFLQMRQEIINLCGDTLRWTKNIYLFLMAFTFICFMAWIVQLVYATIDLIKGDSFTFSWLINVVCLLIPNICLQCYWRGLMNEVCGMISLLFEKQNQMKFNAKGINWATCGTLVYIRVKIRSPLKLQMKAMQVFAGENQAVKVEESQQKIEESQMKTESTGITITSLDDFEAKQENSKKEILLTATV